MSADKDRKITEFLRKNPRGLTLIELSRLSKYSTHTVAITLAKLEGAQKIEIRKAGSAKLHYWR